MEIARMICLCGICVSIVHGTIADQKNKQMSDDMIAINAVKSMLDCINGARAMSYDEELGYFGNQSILSHVLLLKFNYVDKAGRWIVKDKSSLLGAVLRNNAALFSISSNAVFSCTAYNESKDCFYVSINDVSLNEKKYFENKVICKSMVFHVTLSIRDKVQKIDLTRSFINGTGIPALLGFSSEKRFIETYGGKKKQKWIPVYVGITP